MQELVYILPVHQEEKVLAKNVATLVEHLSRLPSSVFRSPEILLVANGCKDASADVARSLETEGPIRIRAYEEREAGIGVAYHRGLVELLASDRPPTRTWAVLTAADLPFGFSDVNAAMIELERGRSRIIVGSKAHPESHAPTGVTRKAMSLAYRVARRAVVGMRVGDSQGSLFLRLDLAAELVPRVRSRNFFYSTEVCHYAEQLGEEIVEVPVRVEQSARERPSTVRPVRDGLAMARQLVELRRRRSA
ncbi:MAG: hypothetical protein JST00_42630 [Deltaproteobacteria bacterium]|nr:hypothetical protein [Deltaproteobacteria bacterium]